MSISSRILLIAVPVLALAVMLLTTSAHGETGARWLILNAKSEHIDAKNLHANVSGSLENGSLLAKLLGVNAKIDCELGFTRNMAILNSGSTSESKVEFSKCHTYVNNTLVEACTPHSKGKGAGIVETNSISGLIVLHTLKSGEKDELVLFHPSSGTVFVTMEMGSKCVLGETITVSGEVFLEDTTAGGLSTLAAIHKFEEGPLTEIWVQAKTAEHLETSLDGEGDAFLPEPHLLDAWSGEAA